MSKVLIYYAHPGQRHSRANKVMAQTAKGLEGMTFVDLYAEYPRHDIDVEREKKRLVDHDVIVFQFPFYWYSTPSILKEWQDLVLQHGFAYGHGGNALKGKTMLLAITAGGSEEAYSINGYQHRPLRDFLHPLEQTARLCGMRFPAPYVLYSSLRAEEDSAISKHASGFSRLLCSLRDEVFDFAAAETMDVLSPDNLPLHQEAGQ